MAQSLAEIARIKQLYESSLFRDPNIVGLASGYKTIGGVATEEPALIVYVIAKVPPSKLAASRLMPSRITLYNSITGRDEEVVTDVVETGPVFALSYTGRYRPAPGGVSVGHAATTAGTLGGYVLDRRTGELLLLSNNHVLANQNRCQEGDPILQQGPLDGGTDGDAIATLCRWVPLDFAANGSNLVDAAVARPVSPDVAELAVLSLGPGPSATAAAQIGMAVQKCGRTTERTTGGRIAAVDATFRVDYSYTGAQTATFRDVIVISGPERFCQPGDSGSFLLTDEPDPKLTGLLFAGNASGTFSLANHIHHVFNLLDVELVCAPTEVVRETSWEARLDDLRALRDQVLSRLREGKRYLLLLERHNAEIWRILRAHPELKSLAAELAVPLLNALYATDESPAVVFDKTFFVQARTLLEQMRAHASVSLQNTLLWLEGELWRYEDKTIAQMLQELKTPAALPLPIRQLGRRNGG